MYLMIYSKFYYEIGPVLDGCAQLWVRVSVLGRQKTRRAVVLGRCGRSIVSLGFLQLPEADQDVAPL